MSDITIVEETCQEAPSASLDKTDKEFALKLYKDSNAIYASKTQIQLFRIIQLVLSMEPLWLKNIDLISPIPALKKLK